MIILSGASGFIGRRLAVEAAKRWPTTELRCLIKPKDDPFCQTGTSFLRVHSIEPIPADLISGRGLEDLQSPSLVFHLAANTHTWEGDHGCNDRGTESLLRALGPLGPDNHIVFTSTTAVMDNRDDMLEPLRAGLAVNRRPLSRYGLSKLRAEEFLRSEAKRQGFRLSIVRLCTVYGREPRPNTLFEVLKREVIRGTLASRLDWPGLTSFIHVEDVVDCLLKVADNAPEPGEPRTYVLATESRTLAEVACLLYRAYGLRYKIVRLPRAAWRVLRHVHGVCRHGARALPTSMFNWVWRFDMVVNPVFHCETESMGEWFPDLKPRLMADCIGEI